MATEDSNPTIIQSGRRYLWVKDQDLYVIVDADDPDEPLGRFDDDARLEGWLRFRTLEDQLDGEPEPKGFLTRRRAQRASRLRDREVRNREVRNRED